MNTSNLIQLTRLADRPVAVVRMAREERANALDEALIGALIDTAETLREDASLRAVVLTGGTRAFSAGADVGVFEALRAETDLNRLRRIAARGTRMVEAWEAVPALTIAAVEGAAVGGGLSLALACDWRVFARDAYAYVPEARLGLNYGWGTLPRLVALAGPARAKWMAVLCRRHGAEELEQWGLADMVADKGGALAAASALAREAAALPALPVQLIKRAVNAHSLALAQATSHGDNDDLLLCLTDPEGARARASALQALQARRQPGPA